MGNLIPISEVRDDVVAAFRKDMEWQASEKLLTYKKMCVREKVDQFLNEAIKGSLKSR